MMAIAFLFAGSAATGVEIKDRKERAPAETKNVRIDEKLNGSVPMGLEFVDEYGKKIKIGDYFDGRKPVVFTFGYFKCPMLCPLILRGMVEGAKETGMKIGKDYEIVTVSIDPRETPPSAKLQQQKYIEMYGKPEEAAGWHYLTGRKESIEKLADAFGFRYEYTRQDDMYNHTAAIMIVTPKGKISRYLYGVSYPGKTLRLSLVEATGGKIGTSTDRIVLYCFHYDPAQGGYSLVAGNLMKLCGVATLMALTLGLGSMWALEKRRKKITG